MKNVNLTFEIRERFEVQNIPERLQVLMDLVGLINKHYRVYRSPSFYAEKLLIKEFTLNQYCRTWIKKTIHELIQDKIHNEAVRLLMTTDWSAKRIAYETGFTDPGYFSRCFKKRTGFSPKRYRISGYHLMTSRYENTMVNSTDRSG